MAGMHIHITGIVQGVGFRPFVYREALAHGIAGWVANGPDGVRIEARGSQTALDRFVRALAENAPQAARIERIATEPLGCGTAPEESPSLTAGDEADGEGRDRQATPSFRIVASRMDGDVATLVSPDIATCPDCLRELFDPADRRFHYPFINCTACGPRFTIIRSLPYDRTRTSMAAFAQCKDCQKEYDDPLDRRFHAQPNACFECGPHLTWRDARNAGETLVGSNLAASDSIIDRAADALGSGRIVALKGLGGFHLACDATDPRAVARLRERKHRPAKPFAIMAPSLEWAEHLCRIDKAERDLLTGPVRPIVLLLRRPNAGETADSTAPELAEGVAPGLAEHGVMLPYTPLHHLLMAAVQRPLVMTSGNRSGDPIETDDAHAWEALVETGIADALLGNDRPILSRFDDSVVRVVDGKAMPVRRARGYAPAPLPLPREAEAPSVLACGAEQKATFAFARASECFVSQHIGDLENADVLDAWHAARRRHQELFGLDRLALACDLHPGYLASRWARDEARDTGARLVEVQHHHAHIASVLAEHIAQDELDVGARVLGIALDGTGAGALTDSSGLIPASPAPDGTVWGSELLLCTLESAQRIGHLRPWRLPGGAASVHDARRCAYGLLASCGLLEHRGAQTMLEELDEQTRAVTATMVERGISSPITTSMGRLLDAVAALLGICPVATYEGEPAVRLEAAAQRSAGCAPLAPFLLVGEGRSVVLDPAPTIADMLGLLAEGADPSSLALAFHRACAEAFAGAARDAAQGAGTGIVALSGGVFMNRLLLTAVRDKLEQSGLRVLVPTTVPVNDGCIAYGQAAVARRLLANDRMCPERV